MKRYLPKIVIITLLVICVFSVAQPFLIAHAQDVSNSASNLQNPSSAPVAKTGILSFMGIPSLSELVSELLAIIMNAGMSATGFLLTIAAAILNVSIVLTLHIREFVTATPAIYAIWQTMRDLTGFFFIFYLLYAAIQMILNMGSNYGSTIKNIVIAGVLINFSFFIMSVLIDASNVTSQALYNAMIPNSPTVQMASSTTSLQDMAATVTGFDLKTDKAGSVTPGISNIFMNSLKIQSIYDTNGNKTGISSGDQPFKIIFIGIVGMIMMITAAISFILAAAAFVVRLVILVFLLAFSSLWFASMVIPQLSSHVKPITDQLKAMLIFMPVYLLLMYAALRVLNDSNIMGAAGLGNTSPLADPKQWAFGYIVLAVNFSMVIVMLNLPLFVAMSMGGMATKFVNANKYGAAGIWKKVGGWARQGGEAGARGAWINTGGRAASAISRSEGLKDLAARSVVTQYALKGLGGVAGNYNQKLSKQVESRTKFAESLGYNQSIVSEEQARIRDIRKSMANGTTVKAFGEVAIKAAQRKISETKNARKESYADRINKRGLDTLLIRARKNKVAASKIHADVWEAQLKDHKDDMKDIKTQIGRLQGQINATNNGTGTNQQTEALKLLTERGDKKQADIDNLESLIAKAKLTK